MDSVASEDTKDLKAFGLDKPTRTVTLGLADGSARGLEIGAATADKKYQVRVSRARRWSRWCRGPWWTSWPRAWPTSGPSACSTSRPTTWKASTRPKRGVKKTYTKTTTKDKDGVETSKWKRTAPDAKDLETSKVEDALFKVGGVEASELIDAPKADAEYGLDAPAFTLAIRMGSGKGQSLLTIGRKGDAAYARRSGDAAVLKLESAKADDLLKAFKEI